MVSLKELFSITDDHFGVFPVSANPYMRGTLISKEVVKNALGNLNGIPIHPVAISPTSKQVYHHHQTNYFRNGSFKCYNSYTNLLRNDCAIILYL